MPHPQSSLLATTPFMCTASISGWIKVRGRARVAAPLCPPHLRGRARVAAPLCPPHY